MKDRHDKRFNKQHWTTQLFLARLRAKKYRTRFVILIASMTTILLSFLIGSRVTSPKHVLSFQNTSLQVIIHTIDEQYDIHVTVSDTSMLKCNITCTFFQNDNVEEILHCISQSMKAKLIRYSASTYRMQGHGCNRPRRIRST